MYCKLHTTCHHATLDHTWSKRQEQASTKNEPAIAQRVSVLPQRPLHGLKPKPTDGSRHTQPKTKTTGSTHPKPRPPKIYSQKPSPARVKANKASAPGLCWLFSSCMPALLLMLWQHQQQRRAPQPARDKALQGHQASSLLAPACLLRSHSKVNSFTVKADQVRNARCAAGMRAAMQRLPHCLWLLLLSLLL